MRELKLADEIKRQLSFIIQQDLEDPRVPTFTSVTEVKVTRDFSYADVYISVLGTPEEQREAITALENAQGFLRSQLAKQLRSKSTPELRLKLDNTYEEARHIDEVIERVNAKEENKAVDES